MLITTTHLRRRSKGEVGKREGATGGFPAESIIKGNSECASDAAEHRWHIPTPGGLAYFVYQGKQNPMYGVMRFESSTRHMIESEYLFFKCVDVAGCMTDIQNQMSELMAERRK